jgi:magnesium chelatase family protein
MTVIAHEPAGFEGSLVHVEVDIRRGIPGVDLVGLAAGAVKEARERVRAAIRNSGFEFPLDRVLISLAPADLPKEGAAYDLPMALALLGASGACRNPAGPS